MDLLGALSNLGHAPAPTISNTAETVAPERQGTKSVNSLWATNYALCALDYIAVIQALTDFILSIHSADSKINPSVRLVSTARDNERKHISRSSSRKVASHLQEGLATKINLPVSRAIDISPKMGDVMVLEPHQASGNKLDTFCCQRRLRSQALEKRTRREAKRQGLPISGLLARYLSETHDRRGYFCNSPAKRFARWQWLMESNLVRLPDIRIFPYKDLHQATQCFAPRNWLGEGQHGRVYHGRIAVQPSDRRQLQAVAIKRFKPTSADPMYRILAELRVHKVITKHSQSTPPSDLRQLLGVCFHISGPLLVYEFVPNGTLKQHLRRDPRSSHLLSSAMVRLSVAIDVAHSLCELHYGFSLPIYYRNLKSSKILIENDFHAKLADFGDAVIVKTDSDLLTPVAIGTVGYKDPVYEKTCWAGDKTDVYSFGVILMELATHLPAWDPKRPTPLLADVVIERMRGNRGPGSDREDTDSVEQILQPGTAHGGMTLMKDLLYLAVQCCNLDLSCRPRIDEVHAALLQVQLQSIEMLLLCSGDELMIDPPPTCRTPDSPAYTTPWKP